MANIAVSNVMSTETRPPNSAKVIVLDRDGTIVVDRHYLADPDGLEFEPGAEVGLRQMTDLWFRLIVITNQSGVARGMLSVPRLEEIHDRLRQMLLSSGIRLDKIYYCPHAPADGCDCRKPRLGLMRQASRELGFDMTQSIVIGDKPSDVEFGWRAGAITMRVGNPQTPTPSRILPDFMVPNLTVAADIIRSMYNSPA
jgi:D-glycero-D-manno-heptose 1,7-bisphosphate phosphatase